MHPEAYQNCQRFVDKYLHRKDNLRVFDIGAQAVGEPPNCLRPLFEPRHKYTGIDVTDGPNVDRAMKFAYTVASAFDDPADAVADVVVSSSCFEHVPLFWKLFSSMVDVLCVGGLIWIDAPSCGPQHWGLDYWRFLPGCWQALQQWEQERVELLEQYVDGSETWGDNVGVFRRVR